MLRMLSRLLRPGFRTLPLICAFGCLAPMATADPLRPFSVWMAQPQDTRVPVTAPIYLPEISRALRNTPLPVPGRYQARLTRGKPAASMPHRLLRRARDLPVYGGDDSQMPAIHLVSGTTDLVTLARDPALTRYLRCAGARCTLSAPLIIAEDARLVIDRTRLELVGQTGAMIVNHGHLSIRASQLSSLLPKGFTPGEKAQNFRPFLSGQEGSVTHLIASRFSDLGYNAASAYGVSIDARAGERPPTGLLVGNVFEGLYYGFYSHHAENIALVDNVYRDNVVYGIDPHDYSRALWILGNRTFGTQKKHGIIISRGVTDSVIAMNHSYDNRGTGIMVDRHSERNRILYNHVRANRADGIAIYESSDNLIAHNSVVGNLDAGLRLRNSDKLWVVSNYLAANKTGLLAYTGDPGGFARRPEDIYTTEVQARLIANKAIGNTRHDAAFKGCISRLILADIDNQQPGFASRDMRFGGDKPFVAMMERLRELTRGDLDLRWECEAKTVHPAPRG